VRLCVKKGRFGGKKSQHSWDYLGISVAGFREYMESKFLPGMSWENYGNPNGNHTDCWHIDHIRPLSSFGFDKITNSEELESTLKAAWHYTNLQPLWGIDNIIKGDKWDEEVYIPV